MIDTDKIENMKQWTNDYKVRMFWDLVTEVKRLQKEIEVLSKYRDIVEKYDNALLADGDTDPRWSELYA